MTRPGRSADERRRHEPGPACLDAAGVLRPRDGPAQFLGARSEGGRLTPPGAHPGQALSSNPSRPGAGPPQRGPAPGQAGGGRAVTTALRRRRPHCQGRSKEGEETRPAGGRSGSDQGRGAREARTSQVASPHANCGSRAADPATPHGIGATCQLASWVVGTYGRLTSGPGSRSAPVGRSASGVPDQCRVRRRSPPPRYDAPVRLW